MLRERADWIQIIIQYFMINECVLFYDSIVYLNYHQSLWVVVSFVYINECSSKIFYKTFDMFPHNWQKKKKNPNELNLSCEWFTPLTLCLSWITWHWIAWVLTRDHPYIHLTPRATFCHSKNLFCKRLCYQYALRLSIVIKFVCLRIQINIFMVRY